MLNDFGERYYSSSLIFRHLDRVNQLNVAEAYHPSQRQRGPKRLPFVSYYSKLSPRIIAVLKKYWYILKDSYVHIPSFQIPPMLAYRRSTSLKDKLVKSGFRV